MTADQRKESGMDENLYKEKKLVKFKNGKKNEKSKNKLLNNDKGMHNKPNVPEKKMVRVPVTREHIEYIGKPRGKINKYNPHGYSQAQQASINTIMAREGEYGELR